MEDKMSQHIIVRDYDPLWIEKYREESSLVKDILAENCVAIYHIGSTSVPGLAAKPIIDIMAVVRSLAEVDSAMNTLVSLVSQVDAIFVRVAMSAHIRYTYSKRMIGRISDGTLHFVTICVPTKKSGTNMQKSRKAWLKDFLMI